MTDSKVVRDSGKPDFLQDEYWAVMALNRKHHAQWDTDSHTFNLLNVCRTSACCN